MVRAGSLEFELEPIPPFRLDLTVWTLRRRPDNIIDRWDGGIYRRVLLGEDSRPYELAVSQSGPEDAPFLRVSASGETRGHKNSITSILERLLGINIDLDGFYHLADGDEKLQVLAVLFRGFKPPRFASCFEALVNAIACQQLALTMGIRLLNRLAEAYGQALRTDEGIFHAFPLPRDLADVNVDDMRRMGFSRQKARYITGLAQSITEGQLRLEELEMLDDQSALERLRGLKGVGRWTAEYVLLRGLGRTHVFPGDDVGARNNLQRWLGLPGTLNYKAVQEVLAPWKAYGGLVYFHLLLKSLAEKDILAAERSSGAENKASVRGY